MLEKIIASKSLYLKEEKEDCERGEVKWPRGFLRTNQKMPFVTYQNIGIMRFPLDETKIPQ
jgi:hypothetical protein